MNLPQNWDLALTPHTVSHLFHTISHRIALPQSHCLYLPHYTWRQSLTPRLQYINTSKAFNILEEDALSLIKRGDGSTSLVPVPLSKESRNVIKDSDLSWDEFCIAAPHMILAMSQLEWLPNQIAMMTEFWSNLNTHPYRSSRDPLDRDTLLLYQAEQRKLWHQAINLPGHRYNLSQINEELLWQTKDQLYWINQERKDHGRDYTVSVDSL